MDWITTGRSTRTLSMENKLKMYEQFVKDTGIDLMKKFEQDKLNNPVTDIVDSFYVAKAGYYGAKSTK